MFVIGVVIMPVCIGLFLHYQRKLTALTRVMRERGPISAACWSIP